MEKRNDDSLVICKRCKRAIQYSGKDIVWKSGYGYDAKIVVCKECNTPNVIKYIEDRWLSER